MATGNASSSSLISGATALLSASGGGGGGVSSLNSLTGALSLTSTGATITITPSGSTINLEVAAGDTPAFNNITSGTNTSAAMLVGTGASLGVTGSGTIAATSAPASGLTGTTLASNVVTSSLTSVGTLSSLAVAVGNITVSGGATLTGVPTPVGGSDAANKSYVDNVTAGLSPKNAVSLATTGALTVTYANGASGVGATLTNAGAQATLSIDSVNPSVNDRILVKNQAAPAQNGIYTVTNVGSGATNWVMTRATDFDQSSEVSAGAYTVVTLGTVNAGTLWIETGTGPFTIGTTAITFTELMVASQNVTLTGAVTGTGSGTIATSLGSFTSANLLSALTTSTGTGLNVFGTAPTLSNPIVGTQAAGDNSTKAASTAYADNAVANRALTSTHLLVGNGSNVATDVAASGDLTLANTGAFTVAAIQGTTVSGTSGTGNVLFSANSTATGTFGAAAITQTGIYTNSTAGGSSASPWNLTGAPFAGTGTTSTPLGYINAGTAPTTWSTAGTQFGINAGSGFTGNFVDYHVNGGASVYTVDSTGLITTNRSVNSSGGLTIVNSGTGTASGSYILVGEAASGGKYTYFGYLNNSFTTNGAFQKNSGIINANSAASNGLIVAAFGASAPIRFFAGGSAAANEVASFPSTGGLFLGAPDAAAPAAQSISVQNVVAGTSNTAGANFTFKASQGTGTGAGGNITFQTAPAGVTGTAQNALVSTLIVKANGQVQIGQASTNQNTPVLNFTGDATGFTYKGNGQNIFGITIASGALIQFGGFTGGSGQAMLAGSVFGWSPTAAGSGWASSLDVILRRSGAANLAFGAVDAAAPVAQTLSVQNVVAGTSNTAGTNLTIAGSQGTGTGIGGSLIFQVAPAGTTGTSQNALTTALTIDSTKKATFTGTVTAPQMSGTVQALTPGTTVSWDMSLGENATLTPAQNFTLSNPTNIIAGNSGMLTITQDGTGSRVITWGSNYRFAGGTKFVLSTAAGAIDEIAWYSPDSVHIDIVGQAAFS